MGKKIILFLMCIFHTHLSYSSDLGAIIPSALFSISAAALFCVTAQYCKLKQKYAAQQRMIRALQRYGPANSSLESLSAYDEVDERTRLLHLQRPPDYCVLVMPLEGAASQQELELAQALQNF